LASGLAADAAERGRTTVSRQAVEHIAARLTDGRPGAGGAPGPAAGTQGDAAVAARLHGATAVSLAVRCSVPYPRPVARSAEALRELLMTRVLELTGLRVQRVDISVTDLPGAGQGRRVE
jgi:uncharacterized alkaline shock family protein YloU